MSLYSAPRPARKKPQPRTAKSGRFRPVEALDDPEIFAFVRGKLGSLQDVLKLLEMLNKAAGDDVNTAKLHAVVTLYLRELQDALSSNIVVDAKRAWPHQD